MSTGASDFKRITLPVTSDSGRWVFNDDCYDLAILLSHTRDALYVARKKELEKYGISVGEAGVLLQVSRLGDRAIPAAIARWLFRAPHTIGSKLKRMEHKGLLRRTNDLYKKNLVRISLTDKGEEILNKAIVRESIHDIMSTFSKEERDLLKSLLTKLRDESLKWTKYKAEELELPPTP